MSAPQILKLDIGGIPQDWLTPREAAELIARDLMAWSLGEVVDVFHGGMNRSGCRTVIEVPSILAVHGSASISLPDMVPCVTREKLFMRDRNICAYCAQSFHPRDLQAEHIHPESRGGEWSWMNLVAACNTCNQIKKKNMTPEEAGMKLHYLPYVPSYWEDFILRSRSIKADQMDFLMASVPMSSRLK